ncbi:MAG: transposase [Deltaproteobacteria bacterium]|nr:transposase [Deltaproteobacteria bacterium]
MKKKRNNYTPEEKVAIIKRHLIDKIPVSDICDQYNMKPTVFYRWQKEFFENGAAAFNRKKSLRERMNVKRIATLETKIQIKNEVLSELMEEHVKLKKSLGEL